MVEFEAKDPSCEVGQASRDQLSCRWYRPELDGLRFFAFFGVFMSHALPPSASLPLFAHRFPELIRFVDAFKEVGSHGVDLFFALSSYLITELLLREREKTGTLDIKAFYIRRSLRIWPLYFFFIGICLAVTLIDRSEVVGRAYTLGYLFFAANWVVAASGVWPLSFIGPLWSVSVEEQFYLAWPWVVRRLSKLTISRVALVMLLIATLTRVYLVFINASDATFWTCTLSRLDPIACGTLIALYLNGEDPKQSQRCRKLTVALGVLTVVATAVGSLYVSSGAISPIISYPAAALGVSLVLLGSLGMSALTWKPLVELGKRSYGLYVYHGYAFYLALRVVRSRKTAVGLVSFRVVALLLTVAMAWLSYALLEMKFLKLKAKFTTIPSRDVPFVQKGVC